MEHKYFVRVEEHGRGFVFWSFSDEEALTEYVIEQLETGEADVHTFDECIFKVGTFKVGKGRLVPHTLFVNISYKVG